MVCPAESCAVVAGGVRSEAGGVCSSALGGWALVFHAPTTVCACGGMGAKCGEKARCGGSLVCRHGAARNLGTRCLYVLCGS